MRLAASLFNSQQIPVSGTNLYLPREFYAIDPIAASQYLSGSNRYLEAIESALKLQAISDAQMVDEGAFLLDQALKQLGLNTNLSGARKRINRIMPLSDDAVYKRQSFTPKKDRTGPSTDVEFIRLNQTPMLDWDLPGPDHRDANVTVRNLGDVEDLVQSYVNKHPESMLRVYSSPGGYRAWELGETMTPKDFQPRFEELKADPDYARISLNSTPSEPSSFASRVSHKPGRVDWVAQPLFTVRGSNAQLNPRSAQLVRTLHDQPIQQHYLTSGGVSADAMSVVQANLPTVSQALQKELQRRFKLR